MTDSNIDMDLEMSERNFAISEAQRSYRAVVEQLPVKRSGRLTKEEAAVRRSGSSGVAKLEVAKPVEVQSEPEVPHDPEAALRHARIGVVAVAVLILMLVWIMQRKRGS